MKIIPIISQNIYKKQNLSKKNTFSNTLSHSYPVDSVNFGASRTIFSQELEMLDSITKEAILPVMEESKDLHNEVGRIGFSAQSVVDYFNQKEKELFLYKISLLDAAKNKKNLSDKLEDAFDQQRLEHVNPILFDKRCKIANVFSGAVALMLILPYANCAEFMKESEKLKKDVIHPKEDIYKLSKRFGHLFISADKISESKKYFDKNKKDVVSFVEENKNLEESLNKIEVDKIYEQMRQKCRDAAKSV